MFEEELGESRKAGLLGTATGAETSWGSSSLMGHGIDIALDRCISHTKRAHGLESGTFEFSR